MNSHIAKRPHEGNNIRSLMRILDVKQETIASALNTSQQQVSRMLLKPTQSEETLAIISKVMDVPVEAIKNYQEDAVVQFVANTFHVTNNDNSNHAVYQDQPTFNYGKDFIDFLTNELKEKKEQIDALNKDVIDLKVEIANLKAQK